MKGFLFALISIGCLASPVWAKPFTWEQAKTSAPLAFQNCQAAQAAFQAAAKPIDRENIVSAIDTIPQELCWELMVQALNDENFFVRQRVHQWVLKLSQDEQIDFVRQALSSDQNRVVMSAIQLVSKLPDALQEEYGVVITNLIRYTPSDAIRIEAYAYLMQRDPSLLRPVLRDVNPAVSKLAMYFLQHQKQRPQETHALMVWATQERPDLYRDLARNMEVEKMLAELAALSREQPVWKRALEWMKGAIGKIWVWVMG